MSSEVDSSDKQTRYLRSEIFVKAVTSESGTSRKDTTTEYVTVEPNILLLSTGEVEAFDLEFNFKKHFLNVR